MTEDISFIKHKSVESLFFTIQEASRRDSYFENDLRFLDMEDKVSIKIDLKFPLPSFANHDVKSDAENSIALFESLGNLPIDLSIDERFWTSLCHLYYPDYVFNRWIKEKNNVEVIKERFFTIAFGSDRALARNAISRLWFGAYLTVNTNNEDYKYFFEEFEDKFVFTKTLFSYQDIQSGLLERSLGRNKKITLSILHFFEKNKDKLNKEVILDFLKKVCLLNQHIQLQSLDAKDIHELYKKYIMIN